MRQSWTEYANGNERVRDVSADEAGETDEQLLLPRLAEGDRLAFWAIWMLYRKEFFSLSLRWMGGNREEAEDALSSASLKAWRHLSAHAEHIVNVKGWLIRLLYNHCMSIRRTLVRHGHILQKMNTLPHAKPAWQSIVGESPEDVVSRQEMLQDILCAIGNLPPGLHEAAELRLIRELSYREIATQLNLSPANARKRMEQARAILRTALVEATLANSVAEG